MKEYFLDAIKRADIEALEVIKHHFLNNDEIIDLIKANNYEVLKFNDEKNHLKLLNWLNKGFPDIVLDAFKAENFNIFYWAAYFGHTEVLKWFGEKIPSQLLQEAFQAENWSAFKWVGYTGRIEVLKWFKNTFNNTILQAFQAGNYAILERAIIGNHKEILDLIYQEFPKEELLKAFQAGNYYVLSVAARERKIEILDWFKERFPKEELLKAFQASDYFIFRANALQMGSAETINWFRQEFKDEIHNAIKINDDTISMRLIEKNFSYIPAIYTLYLMPKADRENILAKTDKNQQIVLQDKLSSFEKLIKELSDKNPKNSEAEIEKLAIEEIPFRAKIKSTFVSKLMFKHAGSIFSTEERAFPDELAIKILSNVMGIQETPTNSNKIVAELKRHNSILEKGYANRIEEQRLEQQSLGNMTF